MRKRLGGSIATLSLAFAFVACDGGGSTPPDVLELQESSLRIEVLEWQCGHEVARTAETAIRAEGEFCLVQMDLRNRGSSSLTLEPSCQVLLDERGERFSPDLEVLALDELAVKGFGEPIAPGGEVENTALYFDVPRGTNPMGLEIHETCEGPASEIALEPGLSGDRVDA